MSTAQESAISEEEIPTREDVLNFYKEQNEILELRKENARLQYEIAHFEAERYESIAKMAHYQGMMQKAAQQESSEGGDAEVKRTLKKDK